MSDKKKTLTIAAVILCLSLLITFQATGADAAEKGDRRLIGNFVQDGEILESHWGEAQILYADYNEYDFSRLQLQTVGAFRVTQDIEIGIFIPFAMVDPDGKDSEWGLVNIPVYAKYRFLTAPCDLSAGLTIDLPSGDEDLFLLPGQGEFHLEGFAAARYQIPNQDIHLIGSAGIRYNSDISFCINACERDVDGKVAFLLNVGALFGINDQLDLSAEFLMATEDYGIMVTEDNEIKELDHDLSLLFGGHFAFNSSFKFRGGLQIGLSDGASDVGLIGSAIYQF
ncbi:hypothetical protein ACFL4G_05765 [Thermodesulfobacteriota bacterium]